MGNESNKRDSRCLGEFSSWRRGTQVDDVKGLAVAVILIRDEEHGRRSRGRGVAFVKTKGKPRRKVDEYAYVDAVSYL